MDQPTTRQNAVKPGEVLDGRYKIIRTIGEGGMGSVYLAEHTLIKRRVALKILHAELASDASVVERFMNEARAAGTLGHANIVESTDMGFLGSGVPYIVFEYLEGSVLTDEVYRLAGLPIRRAVKIATQIASALQAAHNAGIVHRDLKSENVFLTDRDDALDHVKVLDFGISKFLEGGVSRTRRGMIMGTPEFMAPEQISDPDNVDARVDIYALGVIMYEMLAGRRPFQNDDPRTLLHRIVHNEPPPLSRSEVPHGLIEVVMTLLHKDPAMRYQSMSEVEAAFDQFATVSDAASSRRSRHVVIASPSNTELDVPRPSISMIGMSTTAMGTPWMAAGRLDTPWPSAANPAMLPTPPARRSGLLYGVLGIGLAVGAFGVYSLLNKDNPTPAAPVVAQAPAPLPAAAPTPAVGASMVAPVVEKISITIDGNVPGTRVSLRRRVADAPVTLETLPNDIVELVEVSAPGRKTVRYWLTFDRPTTLNAVLPKGSGVVEASEEDTLIALGEAVAAQPVVVAVAEPSEPERAKPSTVTAIARVETPAPRQAAAKVPTPRKIGRGDESSTTASSQPAVPTKVETPAEITKAPAVATVETKPEPALTRPTQIEPVVTPKPVLPKQVEGISRAEVERVAGKNRGAVTKCFADGRKANANLSGSITVLLVVSEGGKVVRQQVKSTMNAPLVGACVLKGLPAWSFGARPGGGNVNASYTFTLK